MASTGLLIVLFSLYNIVDSENTPDKYKVLKVITGAIRKKSQMLWFVLGHFKTKKMCKNAIKTCKKLPFMIMFVPDQYKMCNKVV